MIEYLRNRYIPQRHNALVYTGKTVRLWRCAGNVTEPFFWDKVHE